MTDFIYQSFNLVASGIGLAFPDALLVLSVCVSFLFGIQDYRIGLMVQFILALLVYIFFTLFNLPVLNATILIFISLILLTLSLFVSNNGGKVMG